MVATVIVVVSTHDLARGVLVGVLLSGLFFAHKVRGLFTASSVLSEDGSTRIYRYEGQVFFASTAVFARAMDFSEPLRKVVLDLSNAHFWDISAVGALDRTIMKLRSRGIDVSVIGLNQASATLVSRFGVHDKPGASVGGGH